MAIEYTASCRCGEVEYALKGKPITRVGCYCDDCQAAGAQLAQKYAGTGWDPQDPGAQVALFRTDRFHQTKGEGLVVPEKLKPQSPTNRMIATCCGTPLYIGFDKGPFWASFYADRIKPSLLPVKMRIQTKFFERADELSAEVPTYKSFPPSLVFQILRAAVGKRLGF